MNQRTKTIAKMLTILDDLLKFEKFLDREIDFLEFESQYEKLPKVKEFQKYCCFSYPNAMTILKILERLA